MNISFFINNDLECNIALNYLLPNLTHHKIHLYLSHKVGGTVLLPSPLENLRKLEQDFLHQVVFTEIETSHSKGFLSFRQLGERFNAPVQVLHDVTSEETLHILKSSAPDLFISIRFGKIFKGEVLHIPAKGIINLHSAILPDYKGVLGTIRAFQFQEKEVGYTLHFINDSSIDCGNIIHVERMPVVKEKSILWHIIELYPHASNKLSDLIKKVEHKEFIASSPQLPGGRYFSFPSVQEVNEIIQLPNSLYNLSEYTDCICHYYKLDKNQVFNKLTNYF